MSDQMSLDPNLSQEELLAKAEGGHALAQYAVAKQKQMLGDEAETLKWMRRSAEGELFLAQFELGMWHLLGHLVEFDKDKAISLIMKAVDKNFSDALRLMSVLHGMGFAVERSWEKAVEYCMRAADIEDPHTLRSIAFLLMGDNEMKPLCERLIKRAATFNELASVMYLGVEPNSVQTEEIPEGWSEWAKVKEKLLALDGAWEVTPEILSEDPDIKLVKGALSPEECFYLKTMAKPALTTGVQLMGGNPNDPNFQELQNNSLMVYYPVIQDLFTIQITKRLAGFAGGDASKAELPVIQLTETGQEFREHADYMDPDNPQQAFAIQQAGQRSHSIFVYLNDEYEGGETVFPAAGINFKGQTGNALIINNMDAIGLPNEKTRHAGVKVTNGEKWLLTLWLRDRNQVS